MSESNEFVLEGPFLYPASKDAINISYLLANPEMNSEAIAFHSQQAVEKTMKGAIYAAGLFPPRTHDLGELLRMLQTDVGVALGPDVMRACYVLNKYSVAIRYTEAPEIDGGEALEATIQANKVMEALRALGFQAPHIETSARFLREDPDYDDLGGRE